MVETYLTLKVLFVRLISSMAIEMLALPIPDEGVTVIHSGLLSMLQFEFAGAWRVRVFDSAIFNARMLLLLMEKFPNATIFKSAQPDVTLYDINAFSGTSTVRNVSFAMLLNASDSNKGGSIALLLIFVSFMHFKNALLEII